MKQKIMIRFAILSIVLFLLCASIFTFFYINQDRYKARVSDMEETSSNDEDPGNFQISIEEVTYSCPDGYFLQEDQCKKTMEYNGGACLDGFVLEENQCVQTIDAIKKTP